MMLIVYAREIFQSFRNLIIEATWLWLLTHHNYIKLYQILILAKFCNFGLYLLNYYTVCNK